MCRVCTEESHHYVEDRQKCVRCGSLWFWLETVFEYALPILLVGLLVVAANVLLKSRPERLEFLWRLLLRLKLLAQDVSLFSRLKLLVGFYQVCGALEKVYDVPLPEEYNANLGWLMWLGDISLDRILPIGCDRPLEPYHRLMVDGLVPLTFIVLGAGGSIGLAVVRHLRGRLKKRHGPKKKLRAVVVNQLEDSLPWLLPFTYLCSTSIATQAFSAFHCERFEADAGATRAFLSTDLRVPCDASDPGYRAVRNTAVVLVLTVGALPFLYFALLWKSRCAIRTHSPTRLSRGCRFLWAEYKVNFWWFEPVQQLRKLFLTGFVMAVIPESSAPNLRLIAAFITTLSFVVLALYMDPYREVIAGRLYAMQQILLVVVFQAGIIIRLCENQELCRTFGFPSAFYVSLAFMAWSAVLFAVILCLIAIEAFRKTNDSTLRLRNGNRPTVTLESEHSYHTFVSQCVRGLELLRTVDIMRLPNCPLPCLQHLEYGPGPSCRDQAPTPTFAADGLCLVSCSAA